MLNRKVEKYGMTYMAVERVDNLVMGGIANWGKKRKKLALE